MRISVNRVFDDSQVAKTQAYQDLKPYVDYQQRVNDEQIRLSQGNIGFLTNIDCDFITVALKDNEYTTVSVRKQPIGMWVIKQDPLTYPIERPLMWRLTEQGEVQVAVTFTAPDTSTKVNTTIIALFS